MDRAGAPRRTWVPGCAATILLATLMAGSPTETPVPPEDRRSFAIRYAAAWSGQPLMAIAIV